MHEQRPDTERFVLPDRALEGPSTGDGPVLTASQIDRWRHQGFALVDGVVPTETVERLRTAAAKRFPSPGTTAAAGIVDFGSALVFPADIPAFNEVTLHPRLLTAVGQLLGQSPGELRLTQSDLWPKYGRSDGVRGGGDNQDQRIHVDYPNHMLVHPPPWDRPAAVELILYLSDHEDCGGSTAVVARSGPDDPAYGWPIVGSPGIGELDWINDRLSAEAYVLDERPELAAWRAALYRREELTRFTVGTVLFYRHDTWHRGTRLQPGTRRLAHNLTYRRADSDWIDTLHRAWSWSMYRSDKLMERLVARATVDQRTVLGFPRPGSEYWCSETVAAVEARYGPLGMDITPYRMALGGGGT